MDDRNEELAEAILTLKQAGLERAAELLAKVWAAEIDRTKRRRRSMTLKVWLPRARQWAELPADALGPESCPDGDIEHALRKTAYRPGTDRRPDRT